MHTMSCATRTAACVASSCKKFKPILCPLVTPLRHGQAVSLPHMLWMYRPAHQLLHTSPSRLLASAYLWQQCKCVSSQTQTGWTWLALAQTTGRSLTTPQSQKNSTRLTHWTSKLLAQMGPYSPSPGWCLQTCFVTSRTQHASITLVLFSAELSDLTDCK